MSEVTQVQVAAKPVNGVTASTASSQGTAKQQVQEAHQPLRTIAATGGNVLPVNGRTAVANGGNDSGRQAKNVEKAIDTLNAYVQSVQRDLKFSVDEELDRTIIKVIDSKSGDLIRQIPEDIFLELARKLKDDGEFQLVKALG